MLGATHRALGGATGLALGTAAAWPWPQAAAAGVLASIVAGGALSPDLDQRGPWRLADDLLPDEALGAGGPMQHRGLSHWWGLQAAAAVAVLVLVPAAWRWPLWALLAGWASHLLGDFLFGKRGCGRGPGIPLAPWWGHVGLGLKVGGRLEAFVGFVLPALIFIECVQELGMAGPLRHFVAGVLASHS